MEGRRWLTEAESPKPWARRPGILLRWWSGLRLPFPQGHTCSRVLCWNYIQGRAYPHSALALVVSCSVTCLCGLCGFPPQGHGLFSSHPRIPLLMSAEAVCQQGVLGSTRNVSWERREPPPTTSGSVISPFPFSSDPAEGMVTSVLEMGKLRLRSQGSLRETSTMTCLTLLGQFCHTVTPPTGRVRASHCHPCVPVLHRILLSVCLAWLKPSCSVCMWPSVSSSSKLTPI